MSTLFAVTLIIILAAISPGPDFVMVTKNTLLYSCRAGILTALGVSSSLLIHSTYCLLGLAIVISQSLLLFSIIKYIGAAYLIYIGIKSLLAKKTVTIIYDYKNHKHMSNVEAFRQGLLCNGLNPKAILFILAFFTVIIKSSTSIAAQIGFSIEIAVIHLVWFSLLAMMLSHPAVKKGLGKVQYYFEKLMGAVLIGFGIRIAMLHQAV